MKLKFDCRRTLIATFILCGLISISTTPVFANGGIRVHKANQFQGGSDKQKNDFKKDHHKVNIELLKFLSKQHRHRKSSSKFQQPPVLDSRFPNTYREHSYNQKLQSQRHGNHKRSKKRAGVIRIGK